ncbi:MAG: hypothetical protein JWP87_1085 [Labilithrix sp.]|nr:hypothetical protein [Labilithrix sp.]
MSLDVLRARVAFRDRAFIDVMDLALRFLAVHWKLYARVACIVLVPCIALTALAAWAWDWTAAWLMAVILSVVAQVPFTVLASRLVFQEKVSARAVVRAALREIPRILVMRLGWAALVSFATLIFVAPGAWVASIFLFVDEVMILERSRIGPAFGRSQRIAASATGEALTGVLMVVVVPLAAIFLADVGGRAFIGEVLQFRAPAPAWTAGGSVLAIAGFFAIIPYVATARFFLYLNVRTRAEGWDIQTRFAAIAARAEQQEAA